MKKLLVVLVLILAGLIFYYFTPLLQERLSREVLNDLLVWIRAQGVLAPLAFGSLYALATVMASPGFILTITGGLLFGTLWGTVINLTSATVGSCICFLITRYLGRDTIEKLLHGRERLSLWDERLRKHGFYTVLYLRMVPLFPFNVLNYSLGLTKVKFRDHALATYIGMAPAAFIYSSLGAAGQTASLTDPATWMSYRVWGPFLLIIALSLLPKFIKR